MDSNYKGMFSWCDAVINPQWFELPMSKINLPSLKNVWVVEFCLYFKGKANKERNSFRIELFQQKKFDTSLTK